MKLYKFRSLADEDHFNLAKHILGTGQFWCSKFTEFNDPMEGVFTIDESDEARYIIENIYGQKEQYKICSFSHSDVFDNPLLWGYYANGFKGYAIEIDVKDEEAEEWQVKYIADIKELGKLKIDDEAIKKILRSKLFSWQHEAEYRFLKKTENNYCKIGEIKSVYFGDVYRNVANKDQILKGNKIIENYEAWKKELISIAKRKGEQCFSVFINGGKVQKQYSCLWNAI